MASGRRAVVLAATVALAALVEAVWLAPATLLDARIASATGRVVRLAEAEGTLWRGRGIVTMADTRLPVVWEVDVGPLLQGMVRVRIRGGAGATTPHGTITATATGVAVRDLDVSLPATVLAALLGSAPMQSVAGDVSVIADDLDLTPGSGRGGARVLWRGARIAALAGAIPVDLGDVRSTVKAEGNALSGPLTNEGGDLALRGEWKLDLNDRFELTLLLTPRRADQAELRRALAAIGTAEGAGWRVQWRNALR